MKALTRLILIAVMLSASFLVSCASIPSEVKDITNEVCSTYQELRPAVVTLRSQAVEQWANIPEEAKEPLLKIDEALPKLDAAGIAVCNVAQAGGHSVDWKKLLSITREVTMLALEVQMGYRLP